MREGTGPCVSHLDIALSCRALPQRPDRSLHNVSRSLLTFVVWGRAVELKDDEYHWVSQNSEVSTVVVVGVRHGTVRALYTDPDDTLYVQRLLTGK